MNEYDMYIGFDHYMIDPTRYPFIWCSVRLELFQISTEIVIVVIMGLLRMKDTTTFPTTDGVIGVFL